MLHDPPPPFFPMWRQTKVVAIPSIFMKVVHMRLGVPLAKCLEKPSATFGCLHNGKLLAPQIYNVTWKHDPPPLIHTTFELRDLWQLMKRKMSGECSLLRDQKSNWITTVLIVNKEIYIMFSSKKNQKQQENTLVHSTHATSGVRDIWHLT